MLNELDNATNAYRASDAFADDAATDWQEMPEVKLLVAEYVSLFWRDFNGDSTVHGRMAAIEADLEDHRDDFISDNAPYSRDGDVEDWWLDELHSVQRVLEDATMEEVAA